MRKSIAVSTLLSIAFTVVLTLVCCLLSRQILVWMQTPANIIDEAYAYFAAVLLGIPAMILYNLASSIMRALGDSKRPLYFLLLSSVLNIVLGILGGFVGSILFSLIGLSATGLVGEILVSVVGASVCIWIGRKLFQ